MKKNNLILIFLILIFGFSKSINENLKSQKIIELADNGSWGYAGRFAYIVNNTLYFSYLDSEGNTWVASCDSQGNEILRKNIWKGQNDLHSANPLLIRPDGRIQVFLDREGYSAKNIAWKVSSEPFAINDFGELKESTLNGDIIQGRQFYPMANANAEDVYLVINALRDNILRETVLWKSSDGGDTWTEYYNLWGLGKGLEGNRCYTRTYMQNDDIHFVTLRVGWSESLAGNDIGMVEGVYYIRYNINDKNFYFANGEKSFGIEDTPIYETKYFDEIWNWGKDGNKTHRALWSDIVADKDGKPYVAFTVQKSVPYGQSELHDGYWATPNDDGDWEFFKVGRLARGWDNKPERKNYALAIDPEDPMTIYVSLNVDEEKNLSMVHRMRTIDGGKSWNTEEIISSPGRVSTVVIPRVLDKSDRFVNVLWLEGDIEGWNSYNTKILANYYD